MDRTKQGCAVLCWLAVLTFCGENSDPPGLQPFSGETASVHFFAGTYYDFGYRPLGETHTRGFDVTNTGRHEASELKGVFYISALSYDGGYPGKGGTCGSTLPAGETCTLVVTFKPIYMGSFQEQLKLDYFDGYGRRTSEGPVLRGTSISP